MNKLPYNYAEVIEREVLIDTIRSRNDTKRIVYRISTADINPEEEIMREICNHLIKNEDEDTNAMSFFFWREDMPIGMVAALASFTYAPGGSWWNVTGNEPMELVLDFDYYNGGEPCVTSE